MKIECCIYGCTEPADWAVKDQDQEHEETYACDHHLVYLLNVEQISSVWCITEGKHAPKHV